MSFEVLIEQQSVEEIETIRQKVADLSKILYREF